MTDNINGDKLTSHLIEACSFMKWELFDLKLEAIWPTRVEDDDEKECVEYWYSNRRYNRMSPERYDLSGAFRIIISAEDDLLDNTLNNFSHYRKI
jgi:hypothetical protein